ncbi:MAG TPA: biotin/lipoyl-containing protein [Nitrolancea sp.]|nr:biotin/lipoyl-containing protein [Nitrolancea sp.]
MASEVILPKLGMNMETAIITSWYKQEGEPVAVGDILAEVETDKANIELEAEAAGFMRRFLVAEGEQVAVHQAIALIGALDEDITAQEAELRARTAMPAEEAHKARVYAGWQDQGQGQRHGVAERAGVVPAATNGRGAPAAAPASPAATDGRLDPAAIRARLERRGVLPNGNGARPAARTRLVIYGGGLGAKQLLEVTRQCEDIEVVGLIDDNPGLHGAEFGGVRVLGGFAALAELARRRELDGVALSFHSEVRKKVHERIKAELDLPFVPLVDPRAAIGMDVTIEPGALVEAGAVIGPGTVVGEGTIVDVGVVVAHDCYLGAFSHLSPGCTLSGVVCLQGNVLVGVGAALNSTITIGRNVIITPGAAVMNDVPDDTVVSGVPAKPIGASRRGA